MTEPQWCKCRIVEPRIGQRGDALICFNCHQSKILPPKVDLGWVRTKKELFAEGRQYYNDFHKDALIDMLLQRDEQLLDAWRGYKPYDFLDKAALEKQIETSAGYLMFCEE